MLLSTFRRRILNSFLIVVGVFGVLGIVMIVALTAAGSIPSALVHLNYDSIQAAHEMEQAWNALRFPGQFQSLPPAAAIAQFDRALTFELGNITEPGEKDLAQSILALWTKAKEDPRGVVPPDFAAMHGFLTRVVVLNEDGMFARVDHATRLNRLVLLGAGVTLILTLGFAVYLSDGLATRLSEPIKGIAEALHARPTLDRPLKLPTPTTIELRILIKEMRRLWDSLAEVNKINVTEIMRQKRKLETLLASVEDAFLVIDNDETVTQCNELMQSLLAAPTGEIVGKSWGDLSTISENYLLLRDVLKQSGDRESEMELTLGGHRLNFSLRSRRIRGNADETVGRLVLLRDITEKRQRERLRAEIVDLLSHELKTPVQSLGMAAEMLARHKDEINERLRFFVDTINEDVIRIRGVSQQFIAATETQAKTLRLDLRRIALSDDLGAWIKPFEVVAAAKGVKLVYGVEGGKTIWGAVDPVKFPWAVSNLLANAIRVAPEGSTVRVVIARRGDRTEIDVADEGPGVPEAAQRRMYEPFFQGPEGSGGMLGVGLTIAKEVVEGHEGRLDYQANVPRGAVFRISLPAPPDFRG